MSDQHPALIRILTVSVRAAWRPPPQLTVDEWADRFRYLSPEASAEAGPWRNARAPYLTQIMRHLSPAHPAERIVCKMSSQTGKTEAILNFVGYIIDLDPGPILAIQPNVTPMGEAFSKDRIAPMLRDSPTLAEKVGQAKARNSASTITHKVFPGGHLTIAGANSPAGLASRPIRYLVCDELDRWDITKEGDPLLLARKRLQTYRARRTAKELIVSSPTYADLGVCAEYDRCEQHHEWHLACLKCGQTQLPRLEHFTPDPITYTCEHCGHSHDLSDEDLVKSTGQWVEVKNAGESTVGFTMNQWASNFARWDDTLAEWVQAGDDPARKQAVTNTVFALPWDGEGEKIEPSLLSQRAEDYGADCPSEVLAITLGADVQQDRIEVEVVGWGANLESWSLDYQVIPGEPTGREAWDDLLDLYRQTWETPDGRSLRACAMAVDSGAYTQHVYEFVKRARDRWVIPIKGAAGMERDAIAGDIRQQNRRAAKRAINGKPPEILGVDAIKRTIYHHLAARPGKVGFCHFPMGRAEEYYLQLTGERLQVVNQRGRRAQRRWVPIHPHVEALDCRVYAYGALLLYGPDRVKRAPEKVTQTTSEPPPMPIKRPKPARRSGYASSWRR